MAVLSASQETEVLLYQIPEEGQTVQVRHRNWVVTNVNSESLTGRINEIQHLVSLESLEDDALGEQLEVIWELEPGAYIVNKAGLPAISGIDPNYRLDAFLDAVRWGAATNVDHNSLQAPFRSGITIEDYQLDPLVRSLDMARVNLLIADDVGLGKTIEAGLVIQELLIRHRARTVFIICPAGLQQKWEDEMREKFGLEFKRVDTEYLKNLRRTQGVNANPWTSYPRLITSMDWVKAGEGYRLLKEVLYDQPSYPRRFDVMLIDEAHNIAPSKVDPHSTISQRTRLVEWLSPHFTHHLFLTATPHNGEPNSFSSLLELLDNQRFAKSVSPDKEQLNQIMVRRMKYDILDKDGQPVFPERRLEPLYVQYSDEEKQVHNLLMEYTRLREKQLSDSVFANGAHFVHVLLKKRLFSSPAAFTNTLEKHRQSLASGHCQKKRDAIEMDILHQAIQKAEEDYASEAEAEEAVSEAIEQVGALCPPPTSEQLAILDKLEAWGARNRNNLNSKAQAILDWLSEHLKPDGKWNQKRVILFTEYRDTLSWLHTILAHNGYGGDCLMVLHGSLDAKERESIKAAFQASVKDSPVRILLATDAASEGIDLQNHCHYMIHIEIPWNPIVLEQRNGRIDRHGQREKQVFIWHPVSSEYKKDIAHAKRPGDIVGDSDYLMRIALKIDIIREDLGKVGMVLSRQIEEAMLGQSSYLDVRTSEERRQRAARILGADKEQGERIKRLHERLLASRKNFHLSPENIANAVKVALELAGKPALKPVTVSGLPENTAFIMPPLDHAWQQAWVGLEHPHTHQIRPVTFDHDAVNGRDDLVLLHLNHRLVQMSLSLLRAEVWSSEDTKNLHRISVRSVQDLKTPAVLLWFRLVITGGDHHRLHEELTFSGGELRPDSFRRFKTRGEMDTLLEKSIPQDTLSNSAFGILKQCFEANEAAILAAMEARSKERLETLTNAMQRRKDEELKNIEVILDDLASSIEKELEEQPPDPQGTFDFYKLMVQEPKKKDTNALKSRLARIPDEKRQEKAIIEQHYADATPRTFPVAVMFLVPQQPEWRS